MANLFEQIVADYLTGAGYLTKLNVNYRKEDGGQTGSDIDVLAFHPTTKKVVVGECQAGAEGFSGNWLVRRDIKSPERIRGFFKPIFQREWATGLADKVEDEFGTRKFTYTIYCTHLDGEFNVLQESQDVDGNPIEVVTLADSIHGTVQRIKSKPDASVEPTTLGRFVQLLHTARIGFSYQ